MESRETLESLETVSSVANVSRESLGPAPAIHLSVLSDLSVVRADDVAVQTDVVQTRDCMTQRRPRTTTTSTQTPAVPETREQSCQTIMHAEGSDAIFILPAGVVIWAAPTDVE